MVGYEGPLPPPRILEGYEQILPGAAERIFARFEKQSDHRMHLERVTVEGDSRRANWGLACGTAVALSFLAAGVALVLLGHGWEGTAIATVDIAAIVTAYLTSLYSRRGERAMKRRVIEEEEA